MKRLSVLTAAAVCTFSLSVPTFAVTTTAAPWAMKYMQQGHDMGFVTDSMMMSAKENITRIGFAKMVVQFYENATGTSAPQPEKNPFTDCADQDVLAAYALGIVGGVEEGRFAPERSLTREQMCIMLVRTLEKCGVDMSEYQKKTPFTDVDALLQSTITHIEMAYGAGLVSGYNDQTFMPKKILSIQEAVVSFMAMYDFYGAFAQDVKAQSTVKFDDKTVSLGQTPVQVEAVWGKPNRIDHFSNGLERYVYAATDTQYVLMTFENGKLIQIFTPSKEFAYMNMKGTDQAVQLSKTYTIDTENNRAILDGQYTKTEILLDYNHEVCGIILHNQTYVQNLSRMSVMSEEDCTMLQMEMFEIINAKRAELGLKKLTLDRNLNQTAQAHSLDMVKHSYFGYTDSKGNTAFDRMEAGGAKFMMATEVIVKQIGEVPQLYAEIMSFAARSHNILDKHMERVGIGAANQGSMNNITIDLCV